MTISGACFFAWTLIAISDSNGLTAESSSHSDSATTQPVIILSKESFPEDVETEAEYERWLTDQRLELSSRVAEFDSALKSASRLSNAQGRAAVANWILAREIEPVMSRMLHGMGRSEDGSKVSALRTLAIAELTSASELLNDYFKENESDAKTEQAYALQDDLDVLIAFANAMAAGVVEQTAPGSESSLSDASLEILEHLEDPRVEVAALALLWEARLYARMGRFDRAIRILPVVTEAPQREAIIPDFFARLLRCRYLLAEKRYATAWDLTIMLEEESRNRFSTQRRRLEGARSAAWIRQSICDAWSNDTSSSERDTTRTWCEKTTTEMREAHFPDGMDHVVVRLERAAPMLVTMPEIATSPEKEEAELSEKEETELPEKEETGAPDATQPDIGGDDEVREEPAEDNDGSPRDDVHPSQQIPPSPQR